MTTNGTAKRLEDARELGEAFLGFEVCWDFGCHDARAIKIPRASLKELLASVGRGAYVESLDVETCIKHAAKIGWSTRCGGERITDDITPEDIDGTGRPPFVLGVFYSTSDGEKDAVRELGARVRVEGEKAVACPPAGSPTYPDEPCRKYAEKIAKHANEAAETVFNTELSKILCSVGRSLGWIPRRKNGGGVYFLPERRADTVVRILDGLESLSREFENNSTELYAKPRAAKVWARRTEDDFAERIAKLRKRLVKLETEGGNDKTAERASAETVLLKKDLVAFKGLLGEKATELDGMLDALTKAFGDVKPSDVRKRAKEAFAAKEPEPETPAEEPEPETPAEEPEPEPKKSLRKRAAAAFA